MGRRKARQWSDLLFHAELTGMTTLCLAVALLAGCSSSPAIQHIADQAMYLAKQAGRNRVSSIAAGERTEWQMIAANGIFNP